jgi:urease accessory protein UreF
VVVAAYAEAADSAYAVSHVSLTLRRHLESRGRVVAQAAIDEFVRDAIAYLQAVYPRPDAATESDERRMLSHLFWGQLVAARAALGALDETPSQIQPAPATPAVVHTLICTCGAELTSDSEEELYSFARAHAAQQHPAPRRPLSPRTAAVSGARG